METQTLNQLLTVMEEQMKVMDDLTALGQKKSQALVDGKIEQLDVLLRGEQALIWQMGRMEERRFKLQLELAAQMRIHPSQLTLEKLMTNVAADQAERCEAVAQKYGKSAGALSQTNQLNSELVQQAMAYVDFSLQLLGGSGRSAPQIYSSQGRVGPDGKRSRLDNRI